MNNDNHYHNGLYVREKECTIRHEREDERHAETMTRLNSLDRKMWYLFFAIFGSAAASTVIKPLLALLV